MRDDIDVFMSAYASAEDAFEWSYCLALAPFEWKYGDEDVRVYLGESLPECIAQAIADGMISEAQLKKELEGAAWLAVSRIHAISDEELELARSQFSPWDYVGVDLALLVLPSWKIESVLSHASWWGNAEFRLVADLWKK